MDHDEPDAPAPRAHTGRRRNEAARAAIIDAAIRMLATDGYADFAIERLAKEAGVGKQTVYRWWPSKAAVIAEAVGERAQNTIPLPDTGDLRTDLERFFATTFRQAEDGRTLPLLRQMMAVAVQDPAAADSFGAFLERRRADLGTLLDRGRARGDLAADADLDLLTDLSYGLLWYRGLAGHRPLDDAAAHDLAGAVVAAGNPARNAGDAAEASAHD